MNFDLCSPEPYETQRYQTPTFGNYGASSPLGRHNLSPTCAYGSPNTPRYGDLCQQTGFPRNPDLMPHGKYAESPHMLGEIAQSRVHIQSPPGNPNPPPHLYGNSTIRGFQPGSSDTMSSPWNSAFVQYASENINHCPTLPPRTLRYPYNHSLPSQRPYIRSPPRTLNSPPHLFGNSSVRGHLSGSTNIVSSSGDSDLIVRRLDPGSSYAMLSSGNSNSGQHGCGNVNHSGTLSLNMHRKPYKQPLPPQSPCIRSPTRISNSPNQLWGNSNMKCPHQTADFHMNSHVTQHSLSPNKQSPEFSKDLRDCWPETFKAVKSNLSSSAMGRPIAHQVHQQIVDAFTAEDIHLIRLRCMNTKVSKYVLNLVFKKGTRDRPNTMSLMEFYSKRGINVKTFRKNLNDRQLKIIHEDPEGLSYDVTLLFLCIQYGCDGVEHDFMDRWKEGGENLESLLTSIKNSRNIIFHEEPFYNKEEFIRETEILRDKLTKVLYAASNVYGTHEELGDELNVMNEELNSLRDKDMLPQDIDDYKKQVLFEANKSFLLEKGPEDLKRQFDKRKDESVTPVNHIVRDVDLSVKEVFTEMTLECSVQKEFAVMSKTSLVGKIEDDMIHGSRNIEFQDILLQDSTEITKDVILIEGPAGMGKTTLVKKIVDDWALGISDIKGLLEHDLLFHSQCRNFKIQSFKELLCNMMPTVSRSFREQDLIYTSLSLKCLIILDGLDELNVSSANLFDEILCLKRNFDFTLIVTTRLEKIQYIEKRIESLRLFARHIKLLGVPSKFTEVFVRKYYNAIKNKHEETQPVEGLLTFLNETELTMGSLWRLPYNLTLLVILWVFKHMTVKSISTAPELYWEIHKLYKERLAERLQCGEASRHLSESHRMKMIESFIFRLGKESLSCLHLDFINLPLESFQKLVSIFAHMAVPMEELVSAFLQKNTCPETIYSFPHKGLQEFLAAYYIWMLITEKYHGDDIEKFVALIDNVLSESDCPLLFKEEAIKSARKGLNKASFMLHHLKDQETSCLSEIFHHSDDISKYQNVLISLIGIIYVGGVSVPVNIKKNLLDLLQSSGISGRSAWLDVLKSVKCDEYIASFISRQPGILEGVIEVNDSCISAYISLFQVLKRDDQLPFVTVVINVRKLLSDVKKILDLINNLQMNKISVIVHDETISDYHVLLNSLHEDFRRKLTLVINHSKNEKTDAFLDNIANLKFHEKIIHIDNANIKSVTLLLNNWQLPLKESQIVTVAIHVNVNSIQLVSNLMTQVTRTGLRIQEFELWDNVIKDENITAFTKVLEIMMPSVLKDTEKMALVMKTTSAKGLKEFMEQLQEKKASIGMLQLWNNNRVNYDNKCMYLKLFQSLTSDVCSGVEIKLMFELEKDSELQKILDDKGVKCKV